MKTLKVIFVFLVILILFGLYLPKHLNPHFAMSRSIKIKAPVSEVFKRLPDLNEYNKWNPFADSKQQSEVTGTGLNSSLSWKGGDSGEGKMTIVQIEQNHKIKINMEFYKPMKGEGVVWWIVVPTPDGNSELKWTFDQDLPYFSRYFGLFMDKMMGKHFEKGLMTYKTLVETSK
ncbi:MAG: hypothetical protein K0R29_2549 [Pseudobdellovibrio sp.]|jgi:uncharacterized protein YndB with AHSA1/START domain|nr:hypothetical protein [Pseudobdellovibrio sp.]